ncbi:MAG: alpha/beta fold hydrolase [Deinococcales bacterium]
MKCPKFASIGLLALLCLTACLPIPQRNYDFNLAAPLYTLDPSQVSVESNTVAGYLEANTPASLNQSSYLRYFPPSNANSVEKTAFKDITKSKSILLMVPGIFGGAMGFDLLARDLVASQEGLEVWALDRRSNQLEDREAILKAFEERKPALAFEGYQNFQPLSPKDLDFMRYWGLKVHLEDLHQVVLAARTQADKVYLLGHSLGASLVSFYAAYKPEADPERAGQDFLDGLILLDGVLGRTGAYGGIEVADIDILPSQAHAPTLELSPPVLENFGLDVYLQLPGLFGPKTFFKSDVMALYSYISPQEISPFYDFPISNEAAFALEHDNTYGPSTVFSASLGQSQDARYDGNILPVLLGGLAGVYSRSVVGVEAGKSLVTWDNAGALCNLREYSSLWLGVYSDFNEWYFPSQLLFEMASYDLPLGMGPFIANQNLDLPTLAIGAERGLVQNLEGFRAYQNARAPAGLQQMVSYIMPQMAHLDLLCHKANPLVSLIQLWLNP